MTTPTPRQRQILNLIRDTQPASRRSMAKTLGAQPSTLSVHLQALRSHGWICKDGEAAGATWGLTTAGATV
jgi:DNA-binding IclR family transcriptional regulator